MIVKPDFSDASLHIINSFESTNNLSWAFQNYRICEDTPVSLWSDFDNHNCGVYTGITSALFSWDCHGLGQALDHSHSLCPASGRFVYFTSDLEDGDDDRVVVVDLI